MIDRLKKFVELLKKYKLEELEVEDGDFKIFLKKAINNPIKKSETITREKEDNIGNNKKEKEYKILSPMIGIFRNKYEEILPFSEGEKLVKKNQVVAVIEVLGQTVEVRSEVEGVVKEVLVVDGEAVEYNQPLMIIQQKP